MATLPPQLRLDKVKSSSWSRSNARREKPLSDREYADRVKSYARTSTGQHYHNLANYLFGPYQRNVVNTSPTVQFQTAPMADDDECLATMYAYHANASPETTSFSTAEDFSHAATDAENTSTLLFLRGHQPPDLLNAIGARYHVDPEFFRQHLSISSRIGPSNDIRSTSLPSSCGNMFRLPVTTTGSRYSGPGLHSSIQHGKLPKIRDDANKLLDSYMEKLIQGQYSLIRPGSSVVRSFAVHSYEHFSLEQEISIYVAAHGKHWVAIIWLDTGSDLGLDKNGPWQAKALHCEDWEIQIHPTIQHKGGEPLHSWHLARSDTFFRAANEKEATRLFQSAALLHENYGQNLNNDAMALDPFYALTDVFTFVANSETQFLDMIQRSLDQALDLPLLSRYPLQTTSVLKDLVYNKLILDRHYRHLRGIVFFLEHRSKITDWPCASMTEECASKAAQKVSIDYSHLITRCKMLCATFESAMDMLQNNAMIYESHKAIQQAKGVAKLTRLAFFFIPISLTSSIFGMNLREFSQDTPVSLWVWIVTSVVTLVLSYLVLSWGSWRVTDRIVQLMARKERKKPKDVETNYF